MLERIPSDEWMAAVARETHQTDTGFVIQEEQPDADQLLRWFSRSGVELDLCGHATLGAGHCLWEDGATGPITFSTRSGVLTLHRRDNGSIGMDLPAWPPAPIDTPDSLPEALGAPVEWTGRGGNNFVLARVPDEKTLRSLTPDLAGIARIDADVVVVTAPSDEGEDYEFVSR